MKRATGVAQVSNAQGQPVMGLDVRMQTFSLRTGRWNNVASGKTDQEGRVTLSGALVEDDDDGAPQLRLVKASDNAVLSEGGRLTYDRQSEELAVEFGDLVDLGESIAPAAIDARFGRIAHVIAGQPAAVSGRRMMRPTSGTVPGAAGVSIAALRPQLATLNAQIATKDNEIQTLRANLTSQQNATTQLQAKIQRIPQLEAQLASFRDIERTLTTERGRITDLAQQLDRVREENERLRAPKEQTVSTQAVAENLGRQIRQAQVSLGSGGGLALANVRVKLKGVVKDGAETVQLLGKDELAQGDVTGGLAEFDFEFGRPVETPSVDDVVVPDVRSLTEGAVRQVLANVGLRLESVAGPPGQDVAAGQASMQVPAAGTRAARGAAVTVVFAS